MLKKSLKFCISFLILFNLGLGVAFNFTACTKLQSANTINDAQLASDYIGSQIEVNSLMDMMGAVGGIGSDFVNSTSFLPSCATIIYDTNATKTFPVKYITIDFTNADCLNSKFDNQYRRGKVTISWQGRLRDIGNAYSIDTKGYYVNNDRHGIHATVVSHGQDIKSYWYFTYTAVDTIDYSYQSNVESILQYNTTKKFISGYYTVSPLDNVYLLSGSNAGISSQHLAYNINIDSSFLYDNNCYFRFMSGLATVSPSGYSTRQLRFTNGLKCGNSANMVIDGSTKKIFIRPF